MNVVRDYVSMTTMHKHRKPNAFDLEHARLALDAYQSQFPGNASLYRNSLERALDIKALYQVSKQVSSQTVEIDYMGVFAQDVVTHPVALRVDQGRKEILVLDDRKGINFFSPDWTPLHFLPLQNMGVCWFDVDDAGCFWLCDYTGERIVKTDRSGSQLLELKLAHFCHGDYSRPLSLCALDNMVFYLASHHAMDDTRLCFFETGSERPQIKRLDIPLMKRPASMTSSGSRMLITGKVPGHIFSLEKNGTQMTIRETKALHKKPMHIANWHDGAIVDLEDSLIGINGKGHTVFEVSYKDLLSQRPWVGGLDVLYQTDRDILFISDYTHGCVYSVALSLKGVGDE